MGNWFAPPVDGEVSHEEILAKANKGDFHEWNFEAFDETENGYEDVVSQLRKYKAPDYLALDEKYKKELAAGNTVAAEGYKAQMESMVDEVLKIYRSKNIFPIQYYSEFGVMNEIERCLAYKAKFDGNTVSCVSGETEYFNGKSWKRIDSYTENEEVLQLNDDGTASLVRPEEYIHYTDESPFYESLDSITPTKLTGNHDVVYVEKGKYKKETMGKIYNLNKNDFEIPLNCFYEGENEISVSEIALIALSVQSNELLIDSNYLEVDYSGNVLMSESVLGLSARNRRQLLRGLGITESALVSACDILLYVDALENAKITTNMYNMLGFAEVLAYSWDAKLGVYVIEILHSSTKPYMGDFKITNEVSDKYCFTVPSHMLVLRRNGCIFVTGNCGAGVGTGLCRWLFPNIFDTPSAHDLNKEGAETQYKKFLNDQYLRRAIKFCFSYKDGCPTPTAVEGGLRLVGSAPSNFRPMNAKAVYERFCPEGGTIFDYCCVDEETMYYNGYEWKYISDYQDGERVLQFNDDGTAELVHPIEYISYESREPFYEFCGQQGIPSCQTGGHDVVYWDVKDKAYKKVKQNKLLTSFDALGKPVPVTCDLKGKTDTTPVDWQKYVEYLKGNKKDSKMVEDIRKAMVCRGCREYLLYELFCSYISGTGIIYSRGFTTFDADKASIVQDLLAFTNEGTTLKKSGSLYMVSWTTVDDCLDSYKGKVGKSRYCKEYTGSSEEGFFKEVYKSHKYCFVVPSHMLVLKRHGVIYVTGNCGFGGRLLGALTSKNNYKYVGTDPCTETMYHLHQLGEYIEMVTDREDSYELHCCGSEEFRGPAESIDFAFSSPPYFNLEVYSDEPTQCFNKFPELDGWLEGFVRPTIQNIYHMLKPGRFYAVNIADFKVGGGSEVAYVDEWIRISTEEGMPLFDTVYLGVTARAGSAEQAAGELKKENILIFKKPM